MLLFLLLLIQTVKGDDIVQTYSGPIRGKIVASGKVEAFLSIPYAEPPVGSLRFAKPVLKSSWVDVLDTTHLPPPCIQPNFGSVFFAPDVTNMTEDCLYLNIWTSRSNTQKLKPVMFFIHGGGFFAGSSGMELYDGTKLSEYGDVVVVTINYRLSGLGFFTGFIDEAPGSLGLYDQLMAIEWIKKNAKHFQGDPEHIVLFGESAGAFAISLHQISPLSKYLFKRVILQSGSAINPTYSENNRSLSETCETYAQLLGCTSDTVTVASHPMKVVDCLKTVPAEKFSEVDLEILRKSLAFTPRVGNDFLPKDIIDAYRQGEFRDSEVLMGINRDEGSSLFAVTRQDLFGPFGETNASLLFNETMAYFSIKTLLQSTDAVVDDELICGYLDQVKKDADYTYLKAVSDAFGDRIITCGKIFQAEYQSLRDNPVYFYMFNHRPSSTNYSEWIGVAHFEEVQYVFGNPMYEEFTEFENELSRDMMDKWVKFAKVGNPSISGGIPWPRYTLQDPKYYIIGQRSRIDVGPDHYRCERWRNIFRSIIDDDLIKSLRKNKRNRIGQRTNKYPNHYEQEKL